MLISIAIIIVIGMLFGYVCKKVKFPSLFGMILAGIIVGPHMLGWIDNSLLTCSADIRKIALIIILLRAGLKLSFEDLKKVGRPAILMCFLPASLEFVGMLVLAPALLGMKLLDAAILGSVIGAVSPAVVVPRMIKLLDEGYGVKKGIPQMILAGASVDDVYVIVLFTTCTALAQGGSVEVQQFLNIPISIMVGVVVGLLVGYFFTLYFTRIHLRDTVKVFLILAVSFVLVFVEDKVGKVLPFASLIAIMSLGAMVKQKKGELAKRLSIKYDKMWVLAEIFLFVLVGASVEIESAVSAGPGAVLLILGVLLFRMLGVWICTIKTQLNMKERLFCMLAYMPKATVQAAIGGVPLAMGLACGSLVLTVSVIAILLTAPLGAFAIDVTYKRFLEAEQ